jgi:protein phosphatase 2C family protein 2/3
VIADPDIQEFLITKSHDFIILGCDGIFDKMTSEECVKCTWNSCNLEGQSQETKESKKASNVHNQCGLCVETVLKNSLYR